VAALHVEVAEAHERRVDAVAGVAHRGAVAVEAGERAHHVLGPGDHRDAAVAELEQVAGRGEAARPVRGADRGHVGVGVAGRVDDGERDRARPELVLDRRGERREDEHDAERAALQHALEPLGAGRVAGAALGEDDARGALARDVLDAADELHRPDGVELVEDELDERCGARRAGPAPVAVPPEQPLDALAGGLGDVGAAVEDLRDGGDGDAGLGRDGRQGHAVGPGVDAHGPRVAARSLLDRELSSADRSLTLFVSAGYAPEGLASFGASLETFDGRRRASAAASPGVRKRFDALASYCRTSRTARSAGVGRARAQAPRTGGK
jgi:hypothetical protein